MTVELICATANFGAAGNLNTQPPNGGLQGRDFCVAGHLGWNQTSTAISLNNVGNQTVNNIWSKVVEDFNYTGAGGGDPNRIKAALHVSVFTCQKKQRANLPLVNFSEAFSQGQLAVCGLFRGVRNDDTTYATPSLAVRAFGSSTGYGTTLTSPVLANAPGDLLVDFFGSAWSDDGIVLVDPDLAAEVDAFSAPFQPCGSMRWSVAAGASTAARTATVFSGINSTPGQVGWTSWICLSAALYSDGTAGPDCGGGGFTVGGGEFV